MNKKYHFLNTLENNYFNMSAEQNVPKGYGSVYPVSHWGIVQNDTTPVLPIVDNTGVSIPADIMPIVDKKLEVEPIPESSILSKIINIFK